MIRRYPFMKIIAIDKVTENGEKNVAVAVEYKKAVRNEELNVQSFSVSGRRITRVYANDVDKVKTEGSCRAGRYVILELDYSDETAKRSPFKWDVKDRLNRLKLTYEVRQLRDLIFEDGSICKAWTVPALVGEAKNHEFEKFTKGVYLDANNGAKLVYALLIPENYDPTLKYPLVMYWHGGAEKGEDNIKSLLCTLNGIVWATDEEQSKHPSFVFVPQCPIGNDWIDPDTYEPRNVFEAGCRLLLSILEKYSIDLSRVYCSGFSMGGMAAWESSKRFSKLFAGTIIYAGQANYEGLEILKDSNIWVLHSEDDDKCMPGNVDIMETLENAGAVINRAFWDGSLRGEAAVEIAKEQLAKGGHILHSQYQEGSITSDWTHEIGWRPASSNVVVRDWLFSNTKPNYSLESYTYITPAEKIPVKVNLGVDGKKVKLITAGNRHNVMLLNDGSVYAWGFNCTGQVGDGKSGAFSDQKVPIKVAGLEEIVAVAAGNNFSLAAASDGTVYGWGSNICGQLGNRDIARRYTSPLKIEGISEVINIDAGDSYAIALKKDGTVWSWGVNMDGQLGNGSYKRSNIPMQVKDTEDPSGYLSDIIQIEAGVRSAIALKADGTIRCWGDDEYVQTGKTFVKRGPGTSIPFRSLDKSDPKGYITNICGIAEGRCFSAVLKNDLTIYSWGLHLHGELGIGDYTPEIDLSNPEMNPDFFTTVVHPVKINNFGGVVKIAAGMNHMLALKTDGSVWTWGYNKLMGSGVLGAGEMDGSKIPVRVPRLVGIRDIFAGFNHNFAIGTDGTIWAWGNANNGRLGPVIEEHL
jgi:alpha-tubulin suppressor-like RCC1 family protein/predicted peptidase